MVKVKFVQNGFETVMKDDVAKIYEKKGKVKIGAKVVEQKADAPAKEPKTKEPKTEDKE
jgi:hypothetical protein